MEGLEVLSRLPAEPTDRPPLLFLHGASHAAWCWDEHWMPEAAARGWSCHALSLRGHGASAGTKGGLAAYAEDVRRVLAGLPRPPVLVGHSMGGLLVARLIERHPAPAAALLAAPGLRHGLGFGARLFTLHPAEYVRALVGRVPPPGPEHLFAGLDDRTARALAGRTEPESKLALLQIQGPRRRPRPGTTPVLVLGAEKDAVIPPLDVVRTARHYGTRARFVAGIGHDVMLDRGWRRPLDVLLTWLEAVLSRA